MFHQEPDYSLEPSTKALVCALRHRDNHTQLHSERVVELAGTLGRACGLSMLELSRLHAAACFHDVGKIGIPDEILLKPDRLRPEEWEVMQTHSEKGEDIVRNLVIDDSATIAKAVRHHHENYDGTGYPDALAGESIPIYSRIISVCDSYDAMMETRPYHLARSHAEAISVMFEEVNKYDPWIIEKFEKIVRPASGL